MDKLTWTTDGKNLKFKNSILQLLAKNETGTNDNKKLYLQGL